MQALRKRMVPWGGQLSLTVLAQAPTWRCSCPPLRVLGFACTDTEPTSERHRQRHAVLRAAVLMRMHLSNWRGSTQALCERTVPWVRLSMTVLAQAPTWRCS